MSERMLLGTRKGTFLVERLHRGWTPRLSGQLGAGVNYAARDPDTGVLWAALGHGHWGAKLSRSDDDGGHWEDAAQVRYPEGARYLAPALPGEEAEGLTVRPATLLMLWSLAFAPGGRVYVGTIPGGLFESRDGGDSFQLNLPLWNHESRGGDLSAGEGTGFSHWYGTPASVDTGQFAPGIHSILPDPRNPDRLLVAVSTAGVLESTDGGRSWQGRNRGMVMDYLPDPHAEWGHDPHCLALCREHPDHVWQQNHCGVFRSTDGAARWTAVSAPDQGVRFGFPVAVDAADPDTAWVVPAKDDAQRTAIGGRLQVARTQDGGASWELLGEGLPRQHAYDVVYRHALDQREQRLAFGSTTGNLYISEDRGESWRTVANNLPPIYSVRFC